MYSIDDRAEHVTSTLTSPKSANDIEAPASCSLRSWMSGQETCIIVYIHYDNIFVPFIIGVSIMTLLP